MPEPVDRLADLRRDLDAAQTRSVGRHATPPRLFTLPEALRSAMVRVKPSALIGAAALLVLVLAIVGVRAAWAERAVEPVPVTTSRSISGDTAGETGEVSTDDADAELDGSRGEATNPAVEPSASAVGPAESAYVHVMGAVREAGVVQVPAGSRVSDVVEAAGGLSRGADLTRINLARVVIDAERIWIPVEGEELPAEVDVSPANPSSTSDAVEGARAENGTAAGDSDPVKIDLNAADSATLQTLPGVGPVTAESILTWRTEHGSFATVDELLEVSGIGPRTLDKLRPRVIVGGP